MAVKLLDRLADAVRVRGYSENTVDAYRRWVAAFIRFHGLRHPAELGAPEVEAFLAHLAGTRASSTVNQAHAAIQFLYRHVLDGDRRRLDAVRGRAPWGGSRASSPGTRSPRYWARWTVRSACSAGCCTDRACVSARGFRCG